MAKSTLISSTSNNCFWEEFFLEAGVLADRSSKYTAIFVENRLLPSMLGDLDKQVLLEVGIVALGDIWSILRHAKFVLDQGGQEGGRKEEASPSPVKQLGTVPNEPMPKKEDVTSVKLMPERSKSPPPPVTSPETSNKSLTNKRSRTSSPPPSPTPLSNSSLKLNISSPSSVVFVVDHKIERRKRSLEEEHILECHKSGSRSSQEKRVKVKSKTYSSPSKDKKNEGKDSKSKSKKKKKDKKKHHSSKPKHKHKSHKKDKSISPSPSPKRRKREERYRDKKDHYDNDKSAYSRNLPNYSRKYDDDQDICDETVTSSSSKLKLPSPTSSNASSTSIKEEHGIGVGIGFTKPNYVMIYGLNEERKWIEKGMGSVTFTKGAIKCVTIDNASRVLLESEINKDTVFENSKETFMSWTNNNKDDSALEAEEAHGLRFKEKSDFHSVWSQCKEYIGGSITKYNEEGGPRNGLSFGLASMQGWCSVMEDTHSSWICLPGRLKSCSFFSIFDGHGGSLTSTFAADNLLECITHGDLGSGNLTGDKESEICSTLRSAHLVLDRRCRMNNAKSDDEDKSGSTSVSLFVNPDLIFISNLGDSRALLCSEGKVIFATVDHKPGREGECNRIESAGGSVTAIGRTRRINGDLSVSRGFGDFRYKTNSEKKAEEQIISPEPDITSFPRRAYSSDSDFIVLASDGIWDVMGNDEMAAFVQKGMDEGLELKGICNRVLDHCLDKESRDNMSIILVKLHKEDD